MELKDAIATYSNFPKSGIMFRDLSPILADVELRRLLLNRLMAPWMPPNQPNDLKITKIGAFDARGFNLGMAIAILWNLPYFMIRKAGKMPGPCYSRSYGLEYRDSDILEIQKSAVLPTDSVLLVDDVLATGGTAGAGRKLVEDDAGATCVGLSVGVELVALGGRAAFVGSREVPVVSAITF